MSWKYFETEREKGRRAEVKAQGQDLGIDTDGAGISTIANRSPESDHALGGKSACRFINSKAHGSYHFKRPHSPNPDLDWPIDPFDIVQLDSFPPASSGGFSPEEQEFLSHTYSVVVRQITSYISAKFGQSKAADNCLVGLRGAVAPLISAIKASA